ncbi:dCTP deaminase [Candidatus Peregrinibacteria bacterium]|nr:dCTP deaminase [Candidatus Peregrinibacteria bacterium]
MVLSDRDIKAKIQDGSIRILSSNDGYLDQIHASSMDLRLGKYFKVYKAGKYVLLDPKKLSGQENLTHMIEIHGDEPFLVQPGEFALGVTLEKIALPNDIVARVEGRSSLGRLGIVVHSTAGFIDAGFEGTITLEISNVNKMPIALYPGMRVCQIAFEQMSSPAEIPYGKKSSAKYQGQELPAESRVGDDPEFHEVEQYKM